MQQHAWRLKKVSLDRVTHNSTGKDPLSVSLPFTGHSAAAVKEGERDLCALVEHGK